ncbi:MAG: hypothetical protein ACK53K_09175 [Burkholderiales bacterium]
MSVILLVDGLHELYAGTAGGGQVTLNSPSTSSAFLPSKSSSKFMTQSGWILSSRDSGPKGEASNLCGSEE